MISQIENNLRLNIIIYIRIYNLYFLISYIYIRLICEMLFSKMFRLQRSNLLSVLEMLNEPNVDPKIRKSALVQINVMLSDISLHKLFINHYGLPLILDIFNKALVSS